MILRTAFLLLVLVAPSPTAAMEKLGRFRVTFYWVVDESDAAYARSTRVALTDVNGKVIARTSWKFRRHLLLEGSGKLRDGRMVTYQRHVRGVARFRITSHDYGAGIGTCPLVPYRTIAVDPKLIALGTRIYIPELEGAVLPDGTVHDGMFMAHDRSHSIRGSHIDVFTMAGKKSVRPFNSKGIHTGKRVTLFRVARPQKHGCHNAN